MTPNASPEAACADLPLNVEPCRTWRPGQPFRARKSVRSTIGAARSMMRSAARRSDFDVPDLAALAALSADLDAAIVTAAKNLHDQGQSWTVIGDALGISRQAARQRFASHG